ncbi:MAG: TetR/AcrR family transcriptional regulator [bacterium]|nr:TetR/AcrR family transcriptional regulator [bacterium]
MNDLRRIKGERTRRRIMTSASKLLDEKGVKGLSTRNIARAAGLSQSSLYHHFEDLDAILFETMMAKTRAVLEIAGSQNSESLEDYFKALFEFILAGVKPDHAAKGYFTIFDRAMHDPVFYNRLVKMSRDLQAELLENIQRVLGKPIAPETLELIGFGLNLLREGFLSHIHIHRQESPVKAPEDLARELFGLYGRWMEQLAHAS